LRAHVGAPRRSDLSSARTLDDHEPRVGDGSSTREPPRNDPIRAGRERMASHPTAEADTVDASVTLDAEPPDAAAVGCDLDDEEPDDRRSAQHEDERRPSLLVRPAAGDPVTGQPKPIHASRARSGPPALNGGAGALSAGARAPCTSAARCPQAAAAAAGPASANLWHWRTSGRHRDARDGRRRRTQPRLRH
jgi:hypothetical protein